ncbi:MAG: NADH-quinone oxidoreductase subunit NuoE [Nitriliruptorales bacterium]|nr:NADH-quinone oxidoreductase subunit NuoE [Nitriliruptorales bacterium]
MFSPELKEKAQELVDRYPVGRSALLPLLHLVQHQDGYITDDGITECAQLLKLTKAEVNAVATFYSMYKRAPLGRHLVSVCTNFACQVRGAGEVYQRLHEHLGVAHNETTSDSAVTLEHAECLGNCDGAPIVSVDYFNYECLSPDAAVDLVDRVIAGDVPPPTRGYPSGGIRDMQYRLAGLGPVDAAQPGAIPDQATAADAAPPVQDSGPGAPGAVDAAEPADTKPAEFADADGGGAERRGPEGMTPASGEGSSERDPESPGAARTQDQEPGDG